MRSVWSGLGNEPGEGWSLFSELGTLGQWKSQNLALGCSAGSQSSGPSTSIIYWASVNDLLPLLVGFCQVDINLDMSGERDS